MEESKELQGFYKIFRAVIYISVLMEFFEYAIDLAGKYPELRSYACCSTSGIQP